MLHKPIFMQKDLTIRHHYQKRQGFEYLSNHHNSNYKIYAQN